MTWQGYASKHLDFIMKTFQVEALKAHHSKLDSMIIQATGAGKSACFTLPAIMLPPNKIGLVIVPTIALGEDHLRSLTMLKVHSVFLQSTSRKEDFDDALDGSITSRRTRIIITQPEMLFGTEVQKGILERLIKNEASLSFIAIDESHLIYEWAGFRSYFGELRRLKDLFDCPIMALSATLKPANLKAMEKDILRNPVIIKGSIDRPNVVIHMKSYRKGGSLEFPENATDPFYKTAIHIRNMVDRERTIVYCAYANECEKLKSSLLKLNVKCASYWGKMTSNEKKEVFKDMRDGKFDILLATKAFGLGVNLPDIRHVIHLGLPESLSSWMQEFGRAGRDGAEAHAHLLLCDYEDMSKLNFWMTKKKSDQHGISIREDFLITWKYVSKAFTGDCLRSFQLTYFEEPVDLPSSLEPIACCSGCQVRASVPFKPATELQSVLQVFYAVQSKGLLSMYETQIIEWIQGKGGQWVSFYFNSESLAKETTYGCMQSLDLVTTKLLVKGILRQGLSKNYLDLQFKPTTKETKTEVKLFCLTVHGCKIANGELDLPSLPDTLLVAERFLR